MPPWPLTPALIERVGASLKAGGYKSAKLYFSAARREHVVHHGEIPIKVELSMKDRLSEEHRTRTGPVQTQRLVRPHLTEDNLGPSQLRERRGRLNHGPERLLVPHARN